MHILEMISCIGYQSILLLLIILTLSYFYRGKSFQQIKKRLSHKFILIVVMPVILISYHAITQSHLLSIFIIILPLCIRYISLLNTFYIYGLIILNQIIFDSIQLNALLVYLILIILTYISFTKITKHDHKLILIYSLSILFLNIELIIYELTLTHFLVYNIAGIFIWGIFIYLIYYFNQSNKEILTEQVKLFTDKKTNTNNYYCLVHNSYKLLKDRKAMISLILINIDRLKDINKLYGAYCGDHVIDIVVGVIKENTKNYGKVYRLDGDTFCVIAINEKFKMMQTISEHIRLDILKQELIVANNKINLSVSVGGYYGKIVSKNIDDYIEIANDSLLSSKYHGRNRVILNNRMVYHPNIM